VLSKPALELLKFGLGLVPFARPYQRNLDYYFARADRVRLYSGAVSQGKILDGARFHCEIKFPGIEAIRHALQLDSFRGSPRCLCLGNIAIELWQGEKLLTTLSLHHNKTLRVPGNWLLDGVLRDGTALARWLDEQGHPSELESHHASLRYDKEVEEDAKAFILHAPPHLRDLAKSSVPLTTLESRFSSPLELCQELLRWYGWARRPWKPFLLRHECSLDEAIKAIGLETLVQATIQNRDEDILLRGAARYWVNRVTEKDQLRLPDAQWKMLKADASNAEYLAQTRDRVRRKRLRGSWQDANALGPPAVVAAEGPYSNLVSFEDQVYALCNTRIVGIPSGVTIFDCKQPDASFAVHLDFRVALPFLGRVVQTVPHSHRIFTSAESLSRPQIIPTSHSYLHAWTDGEHKICGWQGVLLNSPSPIRHAFLSEKWLYWSTDGQVLRLQLEPPGSEPEILLEHPACVLSAVAQELVSARSDGSLWRDRQQIGTTRLLPLAIAADEDGIYVLTQQSEDKWVLEHSRDGILAAGLPPGQRPSITVTTSHVYGAFGREILAFERLP
jgi:hypothetical protein